MPRGTAGRSCLVKESRFVSTPSTQGLKSRVRAKASWKGELVTRAYRAMSAIRQRWSGQLTNELISTTGWKAEKSTERGRAVNDAAWTTIGRAMEVRPS